MSVVPRASRRRMAGFAVAGFVVLTALAFWLVKPNSQQPVTPEFDTSEAFPQVAQAIDEAREQVRKTPRSGRAWGRLGMLAMAHNYSRQAAECFAMAAELVPSQFRWTYYRGVLDEASDLKIAADRFEAAARLTPRYAPLRMRLARVLMRLNQLDAADREFRAAVELEPDSPYPRIGLGRLELAHGNLESARDHFTAAVELGPWSRDAHLELSRVLNRLGEASQAYREQREAARIPAVPEEMPDPILQEVEELELTGRQLSKRADEAIGRGDMNAAAELLRQVVRERPDLSRPRLNLGQVLQLQGKSREAVEAFQEAVAKFPHEALSHFSLGTAWEMTGQGEQAADAYREAIRLKPDYADAYFCLGILLRKQKDLPVATEVLRQAVSANPGFAPCHLALGLSLAELGDRDAAIEQLRLAVKLAPQDREANEQLERLLKSP